MPMTTPGDRDSPVGPIVLARSLPWQRVKVTFPFFFTAPIRPPGMTIGFMGL